MNQKLEFLLNRMAAQSGLAYVVRFAGDCWHVRTKRGHGPSRSYYLTLSETFSMFKP